MKLKWLAYLGIPFLVGCGTPDPMLHTDDTKGRPGWTKEEEESRRAVRDTVREEARPTTWERTGTHEVEQR